MDWNELLKLLIDKGLLPLLLAIVALWINRVLSDYKSDLDLKLSKSKSDLDHKLSAYKSGLEHDLQTKILIAESRLPSFTSLWHLTFPTSPTREKGLDNEERKHLNSSLRNWYYDKGNGLFLTEELRDLYLKARESLTRSSSDPESEEKITALFSELRTKLKNEIGVYGLFKE